MSERQINDPQSTPQAPASVDASASELASARRRRFIKAGAGVIPVALTLSSRPVLATTATGKCFSASAWGSIQTLVNTTASTYTRKANNAPTVSCFTKDDWKGTGCAGWTRATISCNTVAAVKAYKVSQACGSSSTAGVPGTKLIWEMLNDLDSNSDRTGRRICSDAQKQVLVAWLNFQISRTTNTDVCVIDSFSTNQLTKLASIVASNGGVGPDGKQWSVQNVQDYLKNNLIGRLS